MLKKHFGTVSQLESTAISKLVVAVLKQQIDHFRMFSVILCIRYNTIFQISIPTCAISESIPPHCNFKDLRCVYYLALFKNGLYLQKASVLKTNKAFS